MSTTLVLTEPLPPPGMRLLAARPDVTIRVLDAPTAGALRAALPEADGVVMVMEQPALSADLIECAPRLRVACRMGAGYDNFDVGALTRRCIPLATSGGANAGTVAEHALYLMLALAKRGPALDRAVHGGAWPRSLGGVELSGLTCLVVGYGRIGREVAPRAAAFGMRIVVVDPNVPAAAVARDGYARAETLADGLAQADFVVVACALLASTRGLIGEAALAAMKPSAFVVNVARGPIVDERALVGALREGRIAGAGLDVLETEPPRTGHPLLGFDNVVLTPHTAALVGAAFDRMAVATATNALAGLDGRLDRDCVVNPEVLESRGTEETQVMSATTFATIEDRYRARTQRSAALYREACRVIPAGLTHDSRTTLPYPIYAARGAGPRKWDVDGNEYVDYFGGHGALLLGHSHPAIVAAVREQVALGTHWGSAHELEVRWAELVNRLVPCAERVRFTASGTEATQLALRLARAYTGRQKVLRFVGHFHGWHDQVASGAMSHFDGSVPAGISPAIVEQSIVVPADDVAPAIEALERRDDIAAVIFEPSGASWGQVPLPPGFAAALREATRRRGVVLIMDEVITGFRWSRGGAQARYGVTPDLCVLAKVLAGGLPGGAVAGRADIMDQLDPAAAKAAAREKIGHQGTFNANPLSAAAAVATLRLVETTDACAQAEATAAAIRDAMRRILVEEQVPWGVYGESSAFVIFPNPRRIALDPATFDPLALGFKGIKGARDPALINRLRLALLANGVDIMGGPGGLVSAAHGPAETALTLEAFRAAVRWLKAEGDIR